MSRDYPPFGLRMSPEMKKELKVEAAKNGRSLNAELVQRLERSMRDDAPAPQLRAAIEPPPLSYMTGSNATDTAAMLITVWRSLPAYMRATMWMMAAAGQSADRTPQGGGWTAKWSRTAAYV